MIFRYLVFFTFIRILCYVFTIATPVSDQDSNPSQFAIRDISSYFGFGKSTSTKEEDKSFTLQRTLHSAQHFASDLYYGENQQIRGDMLCCLCFMCCCNTTEEKEPDKTDVAEENSIKYIDIQSSSGEWIGIEADQDTNDSSSPGRLIEIDGESDSEADRNTNDSVNIIMDKLMDELINFDLELLYCHNDEVVHLIRQKLASIKEWIESRPESYFPLTLEDHMIKRFFYVYQQDLERTKRKINLFFKYRSEMRQIFTNRDPLEENLQKMLDIVHILPLLQRTEDGKQLYIIKLVDEDVEKFNFLDFAKVFYNITDVRMKVDQQIPTGDIPIFDFSGVSHHHLAKIISSGYFKDFVKITQEATPMFPYKIFLINVPRWLRVGFSVLSVFLNKTVSSKITLSADKAPLLEHIPRKIIPIEYGGTAETSVTQIHEYWKQKVEENRDWLLTNPWRVDVPTQNP